MKMSKGAFLRMIALAALVLGLALAMSGCSNSPDSVEDPLSQYSGMGVNSVVPFATMQPDATALWTPAPTDPPATAAPTQVGYQDLMFGATGEAVSALQSRLKALRYYGGTIDGKFGESTVSAIKLFQAQMGLQQTGLGTAQLQEAVFASTAPGYSSTGSSYDPYNGPVGDLPDDYEDYNTPVPTKKPTATRTPDPYDYDDYEDDTPRELSRGDKGDQVKDLQRALKALGYYSGSIDGDFGSGTVTAVKRFQQMYGQTQTGIATLALQRKLYSGDAVAYTTPTPKPTATPAGYKELAWGDTGSAVTNLQRRLKALGYLETATAGSFDDATEKAVKRFQRMFGVQETGIATASLQKKLFASDAPKYQPSATATPAPTAQYVALKPGDTGARVKALQRRLKELGYFDGEIGGNYLELTTAAVKRFQKAIGADQTGEASVNLQKKLFADDAPKYKPSATATPAPSSSPNQLKEGDSGDYVSKVQRRLKELGFYSGSVSGGFGKATTTAVKAFQKACDLRQTGVVSRELYTLMMSDEAPDKNAPVVEPVEQQKYVKLSPGDTGTRVKSLQKRLKQLGYFDGDVGGNYLSKTTSAVKAFQKALGWETTGVATIDLQEKLFSDSAPPMGEGGSGTDESGLKALKYKDTGSRVLNLQNRLIELGFLAEDYGADKKGTYGKSTRQAVIDAQMARGSDSDGNADLEFMRFIMSSAAEDLVVILY